MLFLFLSFLPEYFYSSPDMRHLLVTKDTDNGKNYQEASENFKERKENVNNIFHESYAREMFNIAQ